jgi:DNA polymerase-4
MAESVGRRLRAHHLAGRTVTVKVRFHDFHAISRSLTLPGPVDTGVDIARVAKGLLAQVEVGSGVRLLGVGVTNFAAEPAHQLTLDLPGDAADERSAPADWTAATGAVDAIRERFGDDAIVPATLTGRGVKRTGDRPWGPEDPPG